MGYRRDYVEGSCDIKLLVSCIYKFAVYIYEVARASVTSY